MILPSPTDSLNRAVAVACYWYLTQLILLHFFSLFLFFSFLFAIFPIFHFSLPALYPKASFELANSRKRKARSYHKNAYAVNTNGLYNGTMDYVNNVGLTTTSSYFSPPTSSYYSSGNAKYGTPYTASSAQQTMSSPVSNMYTANFSVSPTNRPRGATTNGSTPLQWPSNNFQAYNVAGVSPSVNSPNGVQQAANGGSSGTGPSKFSRGLHTAFNSALTYNAYQPAQNDRYHWVSKPIVKA